MSENEKRVCYFSNIMKTTYAYAFMTMALEVKHGQIVPFQYKRKYRVEVGGYRNQLCARNI